jgi:coenzyme PQQ precursor peptide PqqA
VESLRNVANKVERQAELGLRDFGAEGTKSLRISLEIIVPVTTGELQARHLRPNSMEDPMKWVKPTIEEVCIGLEINDYFPAEL